MFFRETVFIFFKIVHTRETPPHSNRDHSHAIYYFFQKGQRACVYFVFLLLILRLYYTFFSRFFWHTFGQLFVYTTFSAEYIGFEFDIYIISCLHFFFVVVVAAVATFRIKFVLRIHCKKNLEKEGKKWTSIYLLCRSGLH